ncbi:Panacea domain-containing protein [Parabacteroides distasonis]|uniref:Panacea domain-containing protein n=1 Tax=Parabacteroides distasonis TaxID=823 RepID=UPI0018A078A7|nr:type II toxin-antitoxin system antitoxin SocA domain-containing protein [Parabacteroides distasonis]MDB9152239.1 DUF4065 domain-containing protein [Parabacteroides distasonis]MDB9156795.1 DUF4065 domain-containing protein [Parabacteroides distasonis]MDB9165920.1 DUF4065 domain-containing protein [Parabacteroides distasonis]MDB9170327.1 DUF4065 domain-containing protein [Parabacteroides distasonis]MDB9194387.1 DUF4065 domain-containing protein [Parabacteroides distasonis]
MSSTILSSKQVADWILSKVNKSAGDTLSPLKLQKLLYYCQAWHYTIFNKELFDEKIEAWAHGPVVPSQYKRFSYIMIYDAIDVDKINIEKVSLPKETEDLLNEVLGIYGEHSAAYLEQLTHRERPWKETRGELDSYMASNREIPLSLMKEYYTSVNK